MGLVHGPRGGTHRFGRTGIPQSATCGYGVGVRRWLPYADGGIRTARDHVSRSLLERGRPPRPERDPVRRGWHFRDRQSNAYGDVADFAAGLRIDPFRNHAHPVDFGHAVIARVGFVRGIGFWQRRLWPLIL